MGVRWVVEEVVALGVRDCGDSRGVHLELESVVIPEIDQVRVLAIGVDPYV